MGALSVRRGDQAAQPTSLNAFLEFQSPSAALAIAPVRLGARGTTWVVISLVAACAAAMALIPIDKVVTARGRIVSEAPTVVVQPLDTAIVRSIDVREGEVVHKGQLLARLDPTFATADQTALQAQVASLGAEVARLRAEATGTTYRAADATPDAVLQSAIFMQRQAERTAKLENYRQRIDSARAQIQHGMADVHGYEDRLKVAAELERKRVELEKLQVGSQINRLAATDTRLEVQRGLDGAKAQVQGAVRDLQALVAERDGYDQQWRSQIGQDLSEEGRKLSDAQEQLQKARLRHQLLELRAGQDAVVLNVAHVSVGSVMQSGDQFFSLVPTNAPLEVEANVPGNDAGFVHEGDKVTVKFDTFPFTSYGYATGTVRFVSADSFTSNQSEPRSRGAAPQSDEAVPAFYRSRITLGAIKLHDTPKGFHVVPGMPVTADIKVGKRTVMLYLLGRFLPVAMDGMREP
ncbi:MAG: HlyD family type I secretion periplasmic adaptor subunit [Acetobacteraceae bacterium]|nr:HlyD family type I secretion periplasmic adaptor subunit [Acetobacteraceae bacterium]